MPAAAVKTDLPFWQLPVSALLEQLAASPDGLSSQDAALRLARFGPNLIHGERKRALLLQFLAKFRNPLVIILLAASAISAFTGDATSFFIIGAIDPFKSRPNPWLSLFPVRSGGGRAASVHFCRRLPRFRGAAGLLFPYPVHHTVRLFVGGGSDETMVLPTLCRGMKWQQPSP